MSEVGMKHLQREEHTLIDGTPQEVAEGWQTLEQALGWPKGNHAPLVLVCCPESQKPAADTEHSKRKILTHGSRGLDKMQWKPGNPSDSQKEMALYRDRHTPVISRAWENRKRNWEPERCSDCHTSIEQGLSGTIRDGDLAHRMGSEQGGGPPCHGP